MSKTIIKHYNKIIESRIIQLIINEHIKLKKFKIPIHLALGHECIAQAISYCMKKNDDIICSHRNIHYQIARENSLKKLINEFSLRKSSLSKGIFGSMNLVNLDKSIMYTSSILGNNLSVACGLAYSGINNNFKKLTFVITGDGAIEEGSFYESIILSKTLKLPIIFVIEDNEWSLASKINERRCEINFKKFSESFEINYKNLNKNNIINYIDTISNLRASCIKNSNPAILHVNISTLGDRYEKQDKKLKYINYHAGPVMNINISNIILKKNNSDPVFIIYKKIGEKKFNKLVYKLMEKYFNEISKIY